MLLLLRRFNLETDLDTISLVDFYMLTLVIKYMTLEETGSDSELN